MRSIRCAGCGKGVGCLGVGSSAEGGCLLTHFLTISLPSDVQDIPKTWLVSAALNEGPLPLLRGMRGSICPRGSDPLCDPWAVRGGSAPLCDPLQSLGDLIHPIPDRSSPAGLHIPHPKPQSRGGPAPTARPTAPLCRFTALSPGVPPVPALAEPSVKAAPSWRPWLRLSPQPPQREPGAGGSEGPGPQEHSGSSPEAQERAMPWATAAAARACTKAASRVPAEKTGIFASFPPSQTLLSHISQCEEFLYFILQQDKPEASPFLYFNLCPSVLHYPYPACIPTSLPAPFGALAAV